MVRSVPKTLEIAYLPPTTQVDDVPTNPEVDEASSAKKSQKNKFFPGIFLASTIARFVRPVRNLEVGGTEWIGPLE